jgi:hypothetical protein
LVASVLQQKHSTVHKLVAGWHEQQQTEPCRACSVCHTNSFKALLLINNKLRSYVPLGLDHGTANIPSGLSHLPCHACVVGFSPHHQRCQPRCQLPQLRTAARQPPQHQCPQPRQLRS